MKLQSSLQWMKIVGMNLLVLLFLLFVIEIIERSIWTVRSCSQSECDFNRLTGLKVRDIDGATDIGISRFDAFLGYVPREGFLGIINAPGWNNKKVTITQDGFRSNGSEAGPTSSDVLVVGDSFTFGAQVSDDETWPSCLERKLGRGVDNGGVFGYGAAQALRRASLKIPQRNYSQLVFSILVDDDFQRDRLSYYYGFPKPALVRTGAGIAWSAVSDPQLSGTKYNPSNNKLFSAIYGRSQLIAAMVERFFPKYDVVGDRLTIVHPNAADKHEIIEWTLKEFSKIRQSKVLLLQYASPDTTNKTNIAAEKQLILGIANELSLKIVDTSSVLENYKASELWYMYGHHKPFGNEVVCSYLFEHGFHS